MANSSSAQVISKQLEKVLKAAESKYGKRLDHNRTEAEKYFARAKKLESELKTLQADIDITVHNQPMSVSLLHKIINGTAYIKARCWWHGKQREVQVGTIPTVLERIQGMSGDVPLTADLSWEELKDNAGLIEPIKDLAREKLRRYIIKRLEAEYQLVPDVAGILPASDSVANSEAARAAEDTDGEDWYAQWGISNQVEGHRA